MEPAPDLWLPALDSDTLRWVLLFLTTADVFTARSAAASDACGEFLSLVLCDYSSAALFAGVLREADWEERLAAQPRWARCWAQAAGARDARATLLGACEVRRRRVFFFVIFAAARSARGSTAGGARGSGASSRSCRRSTTCAR